MNSRFQPFFEEKCQLLKSETGVKTEWNFLKYVICLTMPEIWLLPTLLGCCFTHEQFNVCVKYYAKL